MRSNLLILHKSNSLRIVVVLFVIGLLAVLPFFGGDPYIIHLMILWLIWSMVACSWSVLLGFLGIFHFAQIAFFGIGGYGSALLTVNVGVPVWLGIVFAGFVSGVFSLGISVTSLRLKGPYIGVVSLGFSECIRIAASNLDFTKAELGIWGVPALWRDCGKVGFFYCILIVATLAISILYVIVTSKYGLAIKAVKESAMSAESVGIRIYKIKISIFFINSFFAGVAGGFYVHYMSGISPEIFKIGNMIDIMVMGIIGGITSVFGPIAGAFLVLFSLEYLRSIQDLRFMIYGVVVILLMIFKPQGVYSIIQLVFEWIELKWIVRSYSKTGR